MGKISVQTESGGAGYLDTRLTKTTGQVVLAAVLGVLGGVVAADALNIDRIRPRGSLKADLDRIAELQKLLASQSAKVVSLEAELVSVQGEDGVHQSDVDAVRAELNKAIAAKDAITKDLSDSMESLKSEKAMANRALDQLNEIQTILGLKPSESLSENGLFDDEDIQAIKALKSRMSPEELQSLKDELQSKTGEINNLKAALDKANADLENLRASKDTECEKLKEKLGEAETARDNALAQLRENEGSVSMELSEKDTQINSLSKEYDRVSDLLSAAESKIASLSRPFDITEGDVISDEEAAKLSNYDDSIDTAMQPYFGENGDLTGYAQLLKSKGLSKLYVQCSGRGLSLGGYTITKALSKFGLDDLVLVSRSVSISDGRTSMLAGIPYLNAVDGESSRVNLNDVFRVAKGVQIGSLDFADGTKEHVFTTAKALDKAFKGLNNDSFAKLFRWYRKSPLGEDTILKRHIRSVLFVVGLCSNGFSNILALHDNLYTIPNNNFDKEA